METRSSQQKEGKSVIRIVGSAKSSGRTVLQLLLPISIFPIILGYPYWPPCSSLHELSRPLLNSLPSLLDRRFMFLLCNVILIFISGDSILVIKELPSKKKPEVYDEYITKKKAWSLAQVSNTVADPKSAAAETGSRTAGADVKEETEAETESEAREAAGGGREEELIPDELEREEEENHFREEDRRFDEFIARGHENWRLEQQQQLRNSKA